SAVLDTYGPIVVECLTLGGENDVKTERDRCRSRSGNHLVGPAVVELPEHEVDERDHGCARAAPPRISLLVVETSRGGEDSLASRRGAVAPAGQNSGRRRHRYSGHRGNVCEPWRPCRGIDHELLPVAARPRRRRLRQIIARI